MEGRAATREEKESRKFSLIARLRSSTHAWRGIRLLFRTSHNAQFMLFFAALAVYLGFLLRISPVEWALVAFSIGLVIAAEAINAAIEIDIDLTSPEYHPYARDTKDVAAGAVLLAVITSSAIGLLIFLPKLSGFINHAMSACLK